MKIAYVVYGYTNPGGTERVLAVKTNYLVKQGYDVSIISMIKETEKPFFKFSDQIKFYYLDISDLNNEKYKNLFIERVTDILKVVNPDISITMGLALTKYLCEVKDTSKKVFEFHFSKYKRKFEFVTLDKYFLGRIFTSIYSRKNTVLAKKYDKFVVLTEDDKKSWRNIPNIEVIPNPIFFIPKSISTVQTKRVISVGRFAYQKGFDHLINIWAIVLKKYPDWKLSIFGRGRRKERLQAQAERLGIAGSIEFNIPTDNIESEYYNSSIYAMTSNYEGFGLVLMEGMACGLPSVSFDCKCGPSDIITDGVDGFLTKRADYVDFANKLSLLIENEELRVDMGRRAHINMRRYDVDKIMPHWIDLFENLTKQN